MLNCQQFVGILTLMGWLDNLLLCFMHENFCDSNYFKIYVQFRFHAELSMKKGLYLWSQVRQKVACEATEATSLNLKIRIWKLEVLYFLAHQIRQSGIWLGSEIFFLHPR